jgi:hypothetical protein
VCDVCKCHGPLAKEALLLKIVEKKLNKYNYEKVTRLFTWFSI